MNPNPQVPEPRDEGSPAERLRTAWSQLRRRFDTLGHLPADFGARLDDVIASAGAQLEREFERSQQRLRQWGGLPDVQILGQVVQRLTDLETRLARIETDVAALEARREGTPWPRGSQAPDSPPSPSS